jgi:hypothetical protein
MSTHNPVPDPDNSAETFQEGMTPVQAFTSKAIPVLPGTPLEARMGRPARGELSAKQVEGDQSSPPTVNDL